MRIKLLCCLMAILLALPVAARPPKGELTVPSAAIIDNDTYIDANKILMFVTNHGNFGRDLAGVFGYDYGTWYPYTGDTAAIQNNVGQLGDFSPNYAAGLWIGAQVAGQTRVIISEYSSEYSPGPMVGGTFAPDNPDFRVYKLYKDSLAASPNEDYLNWPVDQGAPVNDDGTPQMIGDQMLWAVYNDADPGGHTNDAGETAPLGLEVKQTVFAFEGEGSLGNMVFIRYRVFNKGGNNLENCYFSIWYDPDLGTAGDDYVGCDTLIDLGFCYNADNDDGQYGAGPPAMGCDFFQGPLIETGDNADTARMWDTTWVGYQNMGLTSFNKYINGTDPDNFDETYGFMRGLTKAGEPYVYNNDTLMFVLSGDPVAGVGDLDEAPADRRWMQTTGPITFAPGDSTEILCAMIVGQGANNLSSLTVVKQLDKFAQKLYEEGFNPPAAPAKPNVTVARLSQEINLSWDDTSEVDPGEFPFEGYSVWQGETPSGPWHLLATYDLINDRSDVLNARADTFWNVVDPLIIDSIIVDPAYGALVDTLFDLESGRNLPVVMRSVKNTGLTYHYPITRDVINSSALHDLTEYYFRVTAFSFGIYKQNGDVVPNGDRFLESARVIVVEPQSPMAGTHLNAASGDTLEVTHIGPSDGGVEPIVMDPHALTGDTYYVVFEENNPAGIAAGNPVGVAWNLINQAGDTLLKNQTNMSGDDAYFVIDGILMRIMGPALEGADWDYVSADPPNWSPVAVAEQDYEGGRWFTGGQLGGELFFGGVFMEPNWWGVTSVGPTEYPIVEIRWRPMVSYTDLNGDGTFTIGEPYVVDDPALTQGAFMYTYWGDPTDYLGFYDIPFQAWDVTDPDNPRQLNVAIRDRDQSLSWNLHILHNPDDPANPVDTTNLPNSGDLQFNYTWILTSDYDATGTMYGDGTGGSTWFFGYDDGNGVWDGAWVMWLDDRGNGGQLAEECIFTMVPPVLNLAVDTFTFSSAAQMATHTTAEVDLDLIKPVPNPFYLTGGYDPNPGSYAIKFHHLPETCTIRIYNLAGELVRTIDKDDPSTALATWDILTENGLPVASGIYIWVVEAPGFGTKIGKMAVLVEQEVLDIY
jgi:hypothetical protein